MKDIKNTNEIKLYIHCTQCLEELPEGMSAARWQDITAGWTEVGLQIWCNRHKCNIVHIDFQGISHPANISSKP